MKKLVMFLLLFFLAINLVSSQQQTLGGINGFAPGTAVNLTQTCTNCTFVNITYVILASEQVQKVNQVMTKDGTFYYLPLNGSLTTDLGEYIVHWVADPDGVTDSGNYNFYIRNNGTLLTTAESFLYIFLALFNIIAVVFFLFHGFTLPYSDKRTEDGTLTRWISSKYLKLLSLWIGYGALMWLMSIISAISNTFVSLESTRTLMINLSLYINVLGYPVSVGIMSILLIQIYIDMFVPLFKRFFMGITKRRRN